MTKLYLPLILIYFTCNGSTPRFESNISSNRLSDSVYTSPTLNFRIRIPYLVNPGAKVSEHLLEDSTRVVSFYDDLGQSYYLMEVPNSIAKLTLDSISQNFPLSEAVVDTHYVNTERGTELRITAIRRGAGLHGTRTINGKTEDIVDDVLEQKTIFLRGNYFYDLTVGQSVSDSSKYITTALHAKERLNKFLNGLHFNQ